MSTTSHWTLHFCNGIYSPQGPPVYYKRLSCLRNDISDVWPDCVSNHLSHIHGTSRAQQLIIFVKRFRSFGQQSRACCWIMNGMMNYNISSCFVVSAFFFIFHFLFSGHFLDNTNLYLWPANSSLYQKRFLNKSSAKSRLPSLPIHGALLSMLSYTWLACLCESLLSTTT